MSTVERAALGAGGGKPSANLELAVFEEHRPLLFSIAYRMLGSASEADDVVQEAYVRYLTASGEPVRSPRSLLTTIVTRLCIDQLKSARVRRERYVGTWLPEPLITNQSPWESGEEESELEESISMAFLVLLESLSPVERAVFLLREVFDCGYDEIAEIVGRREDACRQIFHRAKRSIVARRPRFPSSPERRKDLTEGFLRACMAGDVEGLVGLLSEDITLASDGGGKVQAHPRPIHGDRAVARFLVSIVPKLPPGLSMEIVEANGSPAIYCHQDGRPYCVMVLEMDDQVIRAIHTVLNPEKLTHLAHV